ncbi:MAG: permease [Candidatus Ratteibacteria bacterium]|nr:permease [Candidatus Ratteibacteria bacterium]
MSTIQNKKENVLTRIVLVVGISFFLIILNLWNSGNLGVILQLFKNPRIQVFTIVVTAILLEAIPFILIGALLSGLIEAFVSEEKIRKIFPSNRFLSAVIGSFLGIIFPVCSCGNVVVAKRLFKKGVDTSGVLAYMLASPVINPITFLSTLIAFSYSLQIAVGRVLITFIVAVAISLMLSKNKDILKEDTVECCFHNHNLSKTERIFHHAENDFLLMGKYLVLGAIAAGIFQTFISREAFIALSGNKVLSVLLMQILGILLSLCSFADAFVASSFVNMPSFSKIAFMVAGPMMNITVSILYLGTFKKRFVLKLLISIFFAVLILGTLGTFTGRM